VTSTHRVYRGTESVSAHHSQGLCSCSLFGSVLEMGHRVRVEELMPLTCLRPGLRHLELVQDTVLNRRADLAGARGCADPSHTCTQAGERQPPRPAACYPARAGVASGTAGEVSSDVAHPRVACDSPQPRFCSLPNDRARLPRER